MLNFEPVVFVLLRVLLLLHSSKIPLALLTFDSALDSGYTKPFQTDKGLICYPDDHKFSFSPYIFATEVLTT